jgi:glycosyltransferase involved in cell wall biosynthesis
VIVETAVLTGCQDRHYAFGLAMALASKGVTVDVIGSDEIDSPELHTLLNLRFLNFRSDRSKNPNFMQKLWRIFLYYVNLVRYAAHSGPKILHILWNYKVELFDRTILMLYFKSLGKKVALTAHNVNQARRDSRDSWLNRITLKIQYRLCDHIFVHTQKMKDELCHEYGVGRNAVSVIRYPVNNAFPDTELTAHGAKRLLGLSNNQRVMLFFGRVVPYKGIEYLLEAVRLLMTDRQADYRLIIAGEPKKGSEEYLKDIQGFVDRNFFPGQVVLRMQFIPDHEIELYLKGADVLVLPYMEIFQSGVLFLAYTFGLPVVATDVGSFRQEVVEGLTGFLCKPGDPVELARALRTYFRSDLYKNLPVHRQELQAHAKRNHSWDAAAEITCNAYAQMLGRKPA